MKVRRSLGAGSCPFPHTHPLQLLLLAAGLLAGGIAAADAPESVLTLAAAQRGALERSRELPAIDQSATAYSEMAVAAGQLPDPVISAGVENVPVDGGDRFSLSRDFMTMRSIGVMQEIPRTDKRRHRRERYVREADAAQAERALTAARIQRDAALAWLKLYYAQSREKLFHEQIELAELEIQAAEGAYRAGQGSQANVHRSRLGRSEAENRISELRRSVSTAKTALARWIGDRASLPLAAKPATEAIAIEQDGLETRLMRHPELLVFDRREEVARAEAKLADANRQADWTVSASFAQRGSQYSNMASIGVSIPLQWNRKDRQDRELTARLALVEKVRAERDAAQRALFAEVRTMMEAWSNSRERVGRVEREMIPLAGERAQAVIAAYRGGKASLDDVLAARREAIDFRLQALDLQEETDGLWARLRYWVDGGPLAETGSPRSGATGEDSK